jgi:Holliday junction resolvase
MQNERLIQRKIISYLRSTGWKVYKINDRFCSGIPDIYCVKDGRHFWFEVKSLAGQATKLQLHELADLLDHGASACVVRSLDDVLFKIGDK